ncbi:MAG: hypothetical protein ACTSQV_08920, partial [Alphaproteobacteria bacterium]
MRFMAADWHESAARASANAHRAGAGCCARPAPSLCPHVPPQPRPQAPAMNDELPLSGDDTILPFQFDRSNLRGRVAR